MTGNRRIPILRDVVIPGEQLKPHGHWLPTRSVPRESMPASWPQEISMDLQFRAERILPVIRKRALRAGTATLRNSLGFDRRDSAAETADPGNTD